MSDPQKDPLLEALRDTEARARAMLLTLDAECRLGDGPARTREMLMPRDDDYAKAFTGEAVARLKQGYEALWESDPEMEHDPEQTELLVVAASSADLVLRTERARMFPGGYADIVPFLAPNRYWVRWKFVEPGETLGMAYDGLVWLDDHWAWFPKPWRALAGGG